MCNDTHDRMKKFNKDDKNFPSKVASILETPWFKQATLTKKKN